MNMDLQAKGYLGDGVYCGFDGYQIWIWASNDVQESEPIALEPSVLVNLLAYAQRLKTQETP